MKTGDKVIEKETGEIFTVVGMSAGWVAVDKPSVESDGVSSDITYYTNVLYTDLFDYYRDGDK